MAVSSETANTKVSQKPRENQIGAQMERAAAVVGKSGVRFFLSTEDAEHSEEASLGTDSR